MSGRRKTRCHAGIKQTGLRERARFSAFCACGWKGKPRQRLLLSAWNDARAHDPLFPQGNDPKDMA